MRKLITVLTITTIVFCIILHIQSNRRVDYVYSSYTIADNESYWEIYQNNVEGITWQESMYFTKEDNNINNLSLKQGQIIIIRTKEVK
jgi:hypothetical protein